MMAFTLVFAGDIRQFDGNPHKTETPFGVPVAAGIGDAVADVARLEEELDRIRTTLMEIKEARMPGEARRLAHLALNTDKGESA